MTFEDHSQKFINIYSWVKSLKYRHSHNICGIYLETDDEIQSLKSQKL